MTTTAIPGTTQLSAPPLRDLIGDAFGTLLGIRRRLYVMRAFVDELNRVTRGKQFQIRNDVVWNMLLDYRDKLVIALYSFSVALRHGIRPPSGHVSHEFMAKEGLFFYLRNHYLGDFRPTYAPHPDDDEYEIEQSATGKAEIFRTLFPTCAGETPTCADIEALCERFRQSMVQLGRDRNKNRAHAHEGDAGQARMHSVDDLERLFRECEEMLENLSLASAGPSFGGGDLNAADTAETATDLVDVILFGNVSDIRRLVQNRTRDQLYARLHEIDDEIRTVGDHDRDTFFNTRQFDPAFQDFIAPVWQNDNMAATGGQS